MSQKSNGQFPWAMILGFVLAGIVCITGYFIFQNRNRQPKPLKKPPVTIVKKLPVKPPVKGSGKIAIVIDDWGYNKTHCRQIAAFPKPVAIAILPHLAYSLDVLACTKEAGQTPMLHLPLEPYNHHEMFDAGYVLTTEMPITEAKSTLIKILDEMKGVDGVNNHTGSKGSEDEALMTMTLTEIKRRGLFFVDSMTSQKSVGPRVAASLKMRSTKRDVFLDNKNERKAIEAQFSEATKLARENGFVLVIGHDRAMTLLIIAEQMKKLSLQGYEFVTVPDYIRAYDNSRN
ncbi:MAG: divergent polysaccharide deacetylase family protein [Candidatus Omnitrophica bacterium]|nr:divergent polysaccharide deacetylase family protein [Candidatus Omnitrophota bacterium]